MITNHNYNVTFTKSAVTELAKIFDINHDKVFSRAQKVLSVKPYDQSYGSADYPNFKYNGYHWTVINNVILVYSINEQQKKVRIRACYSAMTGFALRTFYGEYDPL